MSSRDLRKWIDQLEAEGELKRITTKVDWNGEIPQIIKKVYEKEGPALLFENIKDHEATFSGKLFTNGLGTYPRYSLMANLPKDTSPGEIIRTIKERVREPLEPVTVATGPVKENIIKGDDVDLYQIPVPMWHPLDGGRYINTFCGTVTRDPDTGEHNVGIYRGMICDRNKVSVLLMSAKDWGVTYTKYKQMGKPMPVAFVYGWDPALLPVSGSPFRGNEYGLAGAVRQEPVELVKCETSDIYVPASAEIVLEGSISPDPATYASEGPCGEGSGCYGEAGIRPVMEVSCITHRNDPIFRGTLVGVKALDEIKMLSAVGVTASAWNVLDSQDIPGVLDMQVGHLSVVKIHKTYQGQARQIAAALWGSKFSAQIFNIVIVVEEEVDIRNFRDVQIAIHDKVDLVRDLVVYPLYIGSPVDPGIPYERRNEQKYGAGVQNKLLIDATTDWETYPIRPEWDNRRFPRNCHNQLPEVEKLVEQRWQEYGL